MRITKVVNEQVKMRVQYEDVSHTDALLRTLGSLEALIGLMESKHPEAHDWLVDRMENYVRVESKAYQEMFDVDEA